MEAGELEGLRRAHKPSGESGTNERTALFLLRWNRSLKARPLHLISQRPILVRRAWRGHFEIVEARQDSHSQPGIRLTPAVKILVGRVIAISRIPPWLLSGWGCLDRRLSRG